jgi:ERCC4-type nuclease
MRIIIDVREHDLIEKCRLIIGNDPNYATLETQSLPIGDILFKTDDGKDVLLVERKSLSDLLASIKDKRYEEQSHRLKHASGFAPHNVVYLIEGVLSSLRTPLEKKLVFSAMTSLYYFKGFAVLRTSGLQESAELLIHMADKIDRNFMKGVLPWYLEVPAPSSVEASVPPLASGEPLANTFVTPSNPAEEPPAYSGFVKKVKKDNITPDNIGEILLCQIPGISTLYAQAILKAFGGFSGILAKIKSPEFSLKEFENITYECKGKQRRIPKTCGEEITRYFSAI